MLVEPWRVTLFGGLRACQGDLAITRFRTRKAASLFAFLACNPQRDHAREEIAERFWPDDDPDAARQKLRLALTSLRHQLEPQGAQTGTVLFADRAHLRLNAQAIETDVAAFETALRAARAASLPASKLDLLTRAISGYAGDLLPGDYEEWAQQERERLKDAYIGALGQTVALAVESCQNEEAIDYARRLLAADPLQEDAHIALMRVYARLARPNDALRQYKELQTLLKKTLDAEPCEEARILAKQLRADGPPSPVQRQEPVPSAPSLQPVSARNAPSIDKTSALALASSSPSSSLAAPAPLPATPRLPLFLTRCFGRENDIQVLTELLSPFAACAVKTPLECAAEPSIEAETEDLKTDMPDDYKPRLVTLTGPGGAGKTRLAVEVATRIQKQRVGKIAFVPLADVTEAGRILRVVADALGLARVEGADVLAQIADHLRDAPALLVLDNFEQLTPTGANVVQTLLARLPLLRCLITSRHHLGLAGERAYAVPPLLPASGAQMFADRAQSVRADFQITPRNAQTVADLCEQMEGIPLAIELCAAWIGALAPAQMLAKFQQRFDLLVSRRDDRVARHRTLRATIAWSYDLLPPDLQTFFARLSVFQGGWSEAAAQSVCDTPHALYLLAQLRERSLVVAEEGAENERGGGQPGSDGEMRFRLLESMREFASENLSASERARTCRAHAVYYARFAETAHSRLEGPEQALWYARLEREHNNIRAALDACIQDAGAEVSEEEKRRGGDKETRRQGDKGATVGNEAAAKKKALEESGTERALRIAVSMRLFWRTRGYLSESRQRLDALLALPDAARYPRLLCVAQIERGLLACTQGDTDAARDYLGRALPVAEREGEQQAVASALNTLGNVAIRLREYDEAQRLYSECAALAERIGYLRLYASALGNLGNAFWRQDDITQARIHYEASLRVQRELANKQGILIALYNLGAMVGQVGDWDGAVAYLAECLTLCREIGDLTNGVYVLEVFGHIAEERAQWARAARLYAAGARLRERLGTPMTDQGRVSQAERLVTLRRELGDAAFETAWHTGVQSSLEQSISFALEATPLT